MKVGDDECWKTCHKEGDVSAKVWDKALGKNYVRIQGTSSSANYIQVPASKFLPKKVLGFTGKYVYLLLSKPEGKNFVVHLDYLCGTRLTKISLSNIYKEFKNSANGSSLQIPMQLSEKWTVVCINVEDVLTHNKCI